MIRPVELFLQHSARYPWPVRVVKYVALLGGIGLAASASTSKSDVGIRADGTKAPKDERKDDPNIGSQPPREEAAHDAASDASDTASDTASDQTSDDSEHTANTGDEGQPRETAGEAEPEKETA